MRPRKVAGTTIQNTLMEVCGDEDIITSGYDEGNRNIDKSCWDGHPHPHLWDVKRLVGNRIWDDYFKFTFVRNPFDITLSRFFWNINGKGQKGFDTTMDGFHKWFEDNDVEFYETELKLVSEQYQFGGTFDAICEVNGKLVICDWKTSNNAYSEFLIQLGAYRQLIQENLDHDIRGAILLRLDKEEKGVYEEHHYKIKDLNWGWKMFKLLLKIQENKR